ncbi:MAG: choice-of-anchor J domain-containing protein [Bacteroidales bacterium]
MGRSTCWADAVDLYSINHNLENCDGDIVVVRTSGYANFASEYIPEGNGTFIGVVSAFNGTMQLYVRHLSDIDLTGERCDPGGGGNEIDPVENVMEYFDDAVNYTDIDIDGWTNLNVAGTRKWQGKVFNDDKYAQSTGYNSGLPDMEVWMITPPVINTNGDKTLTFKSAMAYWEHSANDPITIYASTDYDGTNFSTAVWTEISANLPTQSNANYEWIPSGDISLAGFSGNVAIAFKYKGSDSESTTITIDDVLITGGGGGGSTIFTENFDAGWGNFEAVSMLGSQVWERDNTSGPDGSACAEISGYELGYFSNDDWLISPSIDLSSYSSASLLFESARNYDGAPIVVKISTDYSGNPNSATWTTLSVSLSQSGFNWVSSGNVNLSSFAGQAVFIAFQYTSTTQLAATWRVDNIEIKAE